MGLVTVIILAEYIWRRRRKKSYDGKAVLATIGVAAGQIVTRLAFASVIAYALLTVHAVAPLQFGLDDWRTWVFGFLAVEFAYYWQHRFSHTIRWFWASHAVHHSPNEIVLPIAFRLSWTAGISGVWIFLLPVALVGFHPLVIGTLLIINLRYQFFLHTEYVGRLGPIEWVLNTPSHHRVHHASNACYLDKNFGGILIVFDRLFGTFAAERKDVEIVYGLTSPLRSNNPVMIAFHEWLNLLQDLKASSSLLEICGALFGKPRQISLGEQRNRPSDVGGLVPSPQLQAGRRLAHTVPPHAFRRRPPSG